MLKVEPRAKPRDFQGSKTSTAMLRPEPSSRQESESAQQRFMIDWPGQAGDQLLPLLVLPQLLLREEAEAEVGMVEMVLCGTEVQLQQPQSSTRG